MLERQRWGLGLIGATVCRIAKGECAYAVRCWRMEMKDAEAARVQHELAERIIAEERTEVRRLLTEEVPQTISAVGSAYRPSMSRR